MPSPFSPGFWFICAYCSILFFLMLEGFHVFWYPFSRGDDGPFSFLVSPPFPSPLRYRYSTPNPLVFDPKVFNFFPPISALRASFYFFLFNTMTSFLPFFHRRAAGHIFVFFRWLIIGFSCCCMYFYPLFTSRFFLDTFSSEGPFSPPPNEGVGLDLKILFSPPPRFFPPSALFPFSLPNLFFFFWS